MKELYKIAKMVSAYEFVEDIQTIAEKRGQKDEGWNKLAKLLRYINSHVRHTGEFPGEV